MSTARASAANSPFSPSSIGAKFGAVPEASWFAPHWTKLYNECLATIDLQMADFGDHPEDIVLTLARLMNWTEGETYKQLFTRYRVLPLRGGALNLSNDVLDYFAQFQSGFQPGGWLPLQKIGPGIVFAHFLPNYPKPNIPGFFQAHCMVDCRTYLRLYADFLHYDEEAIRKEYGMTVTAAEVTEEVVHDLAALVQLLMRLSHRNGTDVRKLAEFRDVALGPDDDPHAMAMLVGKVSPEYTAWINAKLSEFQDSVTHQLGITSVPLGVIDPRDIAYGEQERHLNIPPARRQWLTDNQMLPIFVEGSFVLCASPGLTDTALQHRLMDNLHTLDVFCVLCTEKAIHWVLNERNRESSAAGAMEIIRTTEEVVLGVSGTVDIDSSIDLDDNDSTKDFVKRVIGNAIDMGASDIHFEQTGTAFRIRYRIDGLMRDVYQPLRAEVAPYVIRVIKSTAGMNITETRTPLDGRMRVSFKNRAIDLRIATIPVEAGSGMSANDYEKCVIRILDSGTAPTRLEDVMWNLDQRETMKRLLAADYGLIVITGPTGSGKSTTIYSALSEINTPDINIMAVEDPVERKLAGVNQSRVTEQMSYPAAIRAHLRLDPDVILIGEVRDTESAKLSIQASQTGHLVFTTVHANNAVGVIDRYRNFGVLPPDIASTVLLVTAQRLIRQLCIRCRTRVPLTSMDRQQFSCQSINSVLVQNDFVYAHRGCNFCNNSGYKGRLAVMEMIDINPEIRNAIAEDQGMKALHALALKHGFRPMQQLGLEAVARGATDFAEIGELSSSVNF